MLVSSSKYDCSISLLPRKTLSQSAFNQFPEMGGKIFHIALKVLKEIEIAETNHSTIKTGGLYWVHKKRVDISGWVSAIVVVSTLLEIIRAIDLYRRDEFHKNPYYPYIFIATLICSICILREGAASAPNLFTCGRLKKFEGELEVTIANYKILRSDLENIEILTDLTNKLADLNVQFIRFKNGKSDLLIKTLLDTLENIIVLLPIYNDQSPLDSSLSMNVAQMLFMDELCLCRPKNELSIEWNNFKDSPHKNLQEDLNGIKIWEELNLNIPSAEDYLSLNNLAKEGGCIGYIANYILRATCKRFAKYDK